jgi:hypothetical protein
VNSSLKSAFTAWHSETRSGVLLQEKEWTTSILGHPHWERKRTFYSTTLFAGDSSSSKGSKKAGSKMAPLRRSSRRKSTDSAKSSTEKKNNESAETKKEKDADSGDEEIKPPSPTQMSKSPSKGAKKSPKKSLAKERKDANVSIKSEEKSPTKTPKATESSPTETSTKASAKKRKSSSSSLDSSPKKKIKSPKKEKVPVQAITERDPLPKLWTPSNKSKCFKIMSWNVNGLRAVCKNLPTAMSDLVKKYDYPDLVCLQETKLQDSHVEDPKLMLKGHLLEPEGYDSYWSCSTAKKGYSGTAVFIKRRGGKSLNNNAKKVSEEKKEKAKVCTVVGITGKMHFASSIPFS